MTIEKCKDFIKDGYDPCRAMIATRLTIHRR